MSEIYSQHGEQEYLESNWDKLELPEKGIFVEVGAYDGIQLSNTYWLEHVKKWDGVCIEADPQWFPNCKNNRSCRCFDCACSEVDGKATFYVGAPGLSGLNRKGKGVPVEVTSKRLDTILKEAGITSIDVLSIDTEGTELAVWNSFDPNIYKPKLVIVEANEEEALLKRFKEDGYRLDTKLGGVNLIFIREE